MQHRTTITLFNRLQTRTKNCGAFVAKKQEIRNNFGCAFTTYSTVCTTLLFDMSKMHHKALKIWGHVVLQKILIYFPKLEIYEKSEV